MDKMYIRETFVTDNIPDNEIINRILRGEKNLYALIVRRYNQRLYRVSMSIINDDAEVEDAMQVAYINAYETSERLPSKQVFQPG